MIEKKSEEKVIEKTYAPKGRYDLLKKLVGEKNWTIAEHAIHEIYNDDATHLSLSEPEPEPESDLWYVELYFGRTLYSCLGRTLTFHLTEIRKAIEAAEGDLFLEELNRNWVNHNKALKTIRNTLIPVDMFLSALISKRLLRSWKDVPLTRATPRTEIGLNLWRDVVIHSSKILARLQDTFLEHRRRKRNGEVINRGLMRNIKKMLMRVENSGLVHMLEDDKYEDLGRMYCLFRLVTNGLTSIRDAMTLYIRDTGKQLVSDPERSDDPIGFVQQLLDLKDKYDKIISTAFNNDKTFQNALNSSFEYFINLNPSSPEFLSLFVDDKLRKGLRVVSKEDVEKVLDKVMRLFRYLQDKYVFEKYYRKHLAKRLLSRKTDSDSAEKSLVDKFKTECGDQFTSKLEGLFTDMEISQDTLQGFDVELGIEFVNYPTLTVQVLTGDFWQMKPCATCNLPSAILGICEKFQSYYIDRNFRRRLCWQTNMGTAELKATFGHGQTYELNVSTYQMCVLMLFNNADRLSYKEIELATKIPASDLKRCLQSLACLKGVNVLRKEPMSKDIAEADSFLVNNNFMSKRFKVKIGTAVAQIEFEAENLKTRPGVEEDRKPQIEAAIVRIMKARRVLDHNNLVAEVTKQLQSWFLPNPVVIKKQIESLIDRDFLERDKVDRALYRYLA